MTPIEYVIVIGVRPTWLRIRENCRGAPHALSKSNAVLVLTSGLVVLAGVVAAGCQPPSSPASAAPAKAAPPAKSGHPKEADLATVELTPEAETRVGIKLATVERKTVPLTSTYGGEVMIPHGRLIAVTSPFVGLIKAPEGSGIPVPGITVKEGQPVFVLVPILSPEARADGPAPDRGRGASQAGDRAAQDRQGDAGPGRGRLSATISAAAPR